MPRRTIDGEYLFANDDELIELVKLAYLRTAKIPSRSASMGSEHYAGAAIVFFEAFGTWPSRSRQWLDGFVDGFEYTNSGPDSLSPDEILYDPRKPPPEMNPRYVEGVNTGMTVAKSIFNWPDSPNIYSKPQV